MGKVGDKLPSFLVGVGKLKESYKHDFSRVTNRMSEESLAKSSKRQTKLDRAFIGSGIKLEFYCEASDAMHDFSINCRVFAIVIRQITWSISFANTFRDVHDVYANIKIVTEDLHF